MKVLSARHRYGVRTQVPPGPPALPGLSAVSGAAAGAAYLLGGERVVEVALRHYGPAMSLRVPGLGTVVVLADPALVRQVFTAAPDVLLGGAGVGPASVIYGKSSMFVAEEPEHLRRRKLLTPPLHGRALAEHKPLIATRTAEALGRLASDEPVSMLAWSRSLTLEVITEVLFGATDAEERHRLAAPFETLLELGLSEQVVARYLLRGVGAERHWGRRNAAWAAVDRVLLPLIAERRADPLLSERTDVLSLLVTATSEEGLGLTDREIRDDLITLMLAGHETTATTLAWVVERLLRDPVAMQRATDEARGGQSTEYLEAVVNETLRLHPPVVVTGRVTTDYYRLGEWLLPPNTHIVPHIGSVNRDPSTYPDPDVFRPERFLGQRPDQIAWIPFGGGIKRCLGAAFSALELTTMLEVILGNGDLQAARATPAHPKRTSVVVVPSGGVPVRYRPVHSEVVMATA